MVEENKFDITGSCCFDNHSEFVRQLDKWIKEYSKTGNLTTSQEFKEGWENACSGILMFLEDK